MRPDISEEEAIRRIVHEGTCADYVDVANVVQQRFGLRVGCGQVEEVVHAMKQESPRQPVPWRHHADIRLTGRLHGERKAALTSQPADEKISDPSQSPRQEVLKFVETMGGFDAAKAAISELENSLKNLMN